ncbi:hypothetical protein HMPREF3038_02400 [Akkermansia sp. KLE1797]|nr:hypothetical protein HMPREF3038_02400 [Akkermansia sp. KLE1797]KXU54867.1 hypothetical protein HMPREF3039_01016 [Akkermansia sp. KLE1798]KZA06250.1 hypothetical protein HMPREF1326_00100 [Akkermansia sp. KLE1605]
MMREQLFCFSLSRELLSYVMKIFESACRVHEELCQVKINAGNVKLCARTYEIHHPGRH